MLFLAQPDGHVQREPWRYHSTHRSRATWWLTRSGLFKKHRLSECGVVADTANYPSGSLVRDLCFGPISCRFEHVQGNGALRFLLGKQRKDLATRSPQIVPASRNPNIGTSKTQKWTFPAMPTVAAWLTKNMMVP